ncbi:MAG: hypothetical protein GEU78_17300 [Actinobacteria bacterium]|nr:hypothetical protein [Actinomycetota bacterium]
MFDVFCSGHAFLGDGRLLVAGGTSEYPRPPPGYHADHFAGVRNAAVFSAARLGRENPWMTVQSMNQEPRGGGDGAFYGMFEPSGGGRWYPTLVTLPDGCVAAFGGHPEQGDGRHSNDLVEVFQPNPAPAGNWEAVENMPLEIQIAVRRVESPHVYPRAHLLPNGHVFFPHLIGGRSWFWNSGVRWLSLDVSSDVIAAGCEAW